ncbi:TetR/AcrR family transcriptional regulator [Desulfosporosinus sp. PR]|uniref:TetR/AcrR family transcriptional regulator n=1 Tax=Candidatus Desulfosporosinus nitrosoreducens TaxID=3401928 RepID=UPI0027FE129B|nr:TetR/AcrR family transcriptional regulator [Desulfosporosinus sp. PR]MDQ7092860.1 TetR/AcrR family transcriptional regulator [Desulfosporosinus sp. PR]
MPKVRLTEKMTSRDIQAKERRKQILETAKKLFAANGYHATSMRTINKEVGMSEALTYHYFPGGKLEIFHTIIQEVEEERANDIDQSIKAFNDKTSLSEALLLLAKKMSERFVKDKEFIQIMIQERNLINKEQWNLLSLGGQQFLSSLIKFLSQRAAEGQIRKMDFGIAVSQFMCHIGLVALQQIMYEPNFNSQAYLQDTQKIIDFTVELWSR